MRPKASCVAGRGALACFASVTSHGTTIALRARRRSISCATGSIAAMSRPTSASLHPSRRKRLLIAAPMPLAGPVIIATRPFSPKVH